jgi:hypothetical protein
MATVDDMIEGGADPCGSPGPGPTFPLGSVDDGMQGGPDDAGAAGPGSDVPLPADSSTAAQPRPEDWVGGGY